MSTNNSPSRSEVIFLNCPDGKRVIAAGGAVGTQLADEGKVILTKAFPLSTNTATVWGGGGRRHQPGKTGRLLPYATCAKVQ